jgi:hypothetical protein
MRKITITLDKKDLRVDWNPIDFDKLELIGIWSHLLGSMSADVYNYFVKTNEPNEAKKSEDYFQDALQLSREQFKKLTTPREQNESNHDFH